MSYPTILAIVQRLISLSVQGKLTWMGEGGFGVNSTYKDGELIYRFNFYPYSGTLLGQVARRDNVTQVVFDVTLSDDMTNSLLTAIPQKFPMKKPIKNNYINDGLIKDFFLGK